MPIDTYLKNTTVMNKVINNQNTSKTKTKYYLLKNLDSELSVFRQRVGVDRSRSTYMKYLIVRNHLSDFIQGHYGRSDIRLDDLSEEFIRLFCKHLLDKGLSQSTVWLYQIPLKRVCSQAFKNGQIPTNPFSDYHIRPNVKARRYLTEGELKLLMTKEIPDPKMAFTRDMFVFSCWTGISFADLKSLTEDQLIEIGKSLWIVSQRRKTQTLFRIKLMKVPMAIMKQYEPERTDAHIFNNR